MVSVMVIVAIVIGVVEVVYRDKPGRLGLLRLRDLALPC